MQKISYQYTILPDISYQFYQFMYLFELKLSIITQHFMFEIIVQTTLNVGCHMGDENVQSLRDVKCEKHTFKIST